jgi:hypothetical protein
MREFNVIDAADSVQKLKMRLKDNELEQYGDSFIPEYVYDVIKRLPRFSTMRVSLSSYVLVPIFCVSSLALTIYSAVTNKMLKNLWDSCLRDFTTNAFLF